MLHEYLTKDTVEVGIAGDFTFDAIPTRIYQLMNKCLNVFQIPYLLDAKDDEAIPLSGMPVSEMPSDPAEEICSQTDVIEAVSAVERINASVTAHDFSQSPSEQWALQNFARQPARHALNEGTLRTASSCTRSDAALALRIILVFHHPRSRFSGSHVSV